ncbi:MAG: hypothetical protein QF368_18750, partial [SAR202 cluster bacterium]|nr:hypothetical protein [SAR202 cluster bacterium]
QDLAWTEVSVQRVRLLNQGFQLFHCLFSHLFLRRNATSAHPAQDSTPTRRFRLPYTVAPSV